MNLPLLSPTWLLPGHLWVNEMETGRELDQKESDHKA